MDFSPAISQAWGMLVWLIPAVMLIILFKSPWAKGCIGQQLARLFAHWQLAKQTYRRLRNVTLNTPDGTTLTDRVFLSPYGIFVGGTIVKTEMLTNATQGIGFVRYIQPFRQTVLGAAAVDTMLHALHTGGAMSFAT